MFANCCGLATIVAWRQPLLGPIRSYLPPRPRFRESEPRPVTTWARSRGNFLPQIRLASSRDQQICRHASPRIAKRDSNHIPAAVDLSIRPACDARIESYDAWHQSCSKRIASFLWAGTFCARFRHAMMQPATRTPTAGSSFIRTTEQRRAQFVAEVFDRRRNWGTRL